MTGGGSYDQGTLQTVTATANSGWQFAGWSGAGITTPAATTTTVLVAGNKTVSANFTAPEGYGSWATNPAQGLTAGVNDGAGDDPDHDGIPNLLEFALGGNPTVSSRTILPVLSKATGAWTFEYERSDVSLSSTTQVVEYGDDLTGWTRVTIPATSNAPVTITPGSPSDHVKVTLPDSGSKVFARLKVSQ